MRLNEENINRSVNTANGYLHLIPSSPCAASYNPTSDTPSHHPNSSLVVTAASYALADGTPHKIARRGCRVQYT